MKNPVNAGFQAAVHNIGQHWPMMFFLLVAIVTTIFSIDRWQSVHCQYFFLVGLVCYAAIIKFCHTQYRLYCASLIIPVAILAVILLAVPDIVFVDFDNPLDQIKKIRSNIFVVPNDALMFSVVFPLLVGVSWSAGWVVRGLAMCYLLLALFVSENLQSRQTALLLLSGVVFVVAFIRPRWMLPVLLVGVATGLLVDSLSGWVLLKKIFMFPRTYVWHSAWAMFLNRPLLGQGPGLFNDLYFTFLSKAGYLVQDLPDRRTMPWPHNIYLEQLAERGILGLLAFIGLLGSSVYKAWQAWRQSGSAITRELAAGIMGSLLVLAMTGIAEASLIRIWVVVSLFVLAAFSIAILTLQQQESK